jgi:nitrogen-specific signal transduction histidine kinase
VAGERTIYPSYEHAPTVDRRSAVRRRASTFEREAVGASAYLTALGAATDGVLLINRAGTIVYTNPAAETFFDDAGLAGQHFLDVSSIERRTLSRIWRELSRGSAWRGRLALRHDRPALDVTVQRVRAESDQFCVVLHGAAQAASREAAAAPNTLQRMASEVAHDFNNQIAVILNYTFVLLRHMPADSPLIAHVSEMQAAAWRASQVAHAVHRALVTHTLLPSGE